ncbi:MAG: response regulator [Calditrichia bacterium]
MKTRFVSPKFRSASFLMTSTEELGAIAVTQKHILLVDDEPNLLNTIEFILEAANYRVSTAADGQKGLAKLLDYQKNNIQVDFTDNRHQMPRLSGIRAD